MNDFALVRFLEMINEIFLEISFKQRETFYLSTHLLMENALYGKKKDDTSRHKCREIENFRKIVARDIERIKKGRG